MSTMAWFMYGGRIIARYKGFTVTRIYPEEMSTKPPGMNWQAYVADTIVYGDTLKTIRAFIRQHLREHPRDGKLRKKPMM